MDMSGSQSEPPGRSNAPKPKKNKIPGGRTITCKLCDFTCKKPFHLNIHIARKHEKLTPYHCTMCDYKTGCRSTIQRHISTHFGATPFKCNACDFRCGDKKALKVHRQHDPHYCDVCDFQCFAANELIQHKVEHNGKRSHQCLLCGVVSLTRKEHKLHQETHEGQKYVCNICELPCVHEKALKKHLKNRHGQH